MADLTGAAARAMAASAGFSTKALANEYIVRGSRRATDAQTFDVFLSHSLVDRQAVLGIRADIESYGLSVYIDWMDDPQMNRSSVSPSTARTLRARMRNSRALVYVMSNASARSVWMPWELGYFDGVHPDHIGLLPLNEAAGAGYPGHEYLGLYPRLQDFSARLPGMRRLGISGTGDQVFTPADLVRRQIHLVD